LRDEIADLLALERRLHRRVGAELEAESAVQGEPHARELLRRLEPRAFARRRALEETLRRIRGHVPLARRIVDAGLGQLFAWAERRRAGPPLTGDLRELYALLAALASGYLVLASAAQACGDAQTASVAESGVDDANSFLDEIAVLLPRLAEEEAIRGPEGSQNDKGRRARL
jgi:hypothetical protein